MLGMETGKGWGRSYQARDRCGQPEFGPAREPREPVWSIRLGVIGRVNPPDLLWAAEQVPWQEPSGRKTQGWQLEELAGVQ